MPNEDESRELTCEPQKVCWLCESRAPAANGPYTDEDGVCVQCWEEIGDRGRIS